MSFLPASHYTRMRERALKKLEGDDGLRTWLAWARGKRVEHAPTPANPQGRFTYEGGALPNEYAMRERYNRWQEAESDLRIAESMLRRVFRANAHEQLRNKAI